MGMSYPWTRVRDVIEGEDGHSLLSMRRGAWFLYRQSPTLMFCAYTAAAIALGQSAWRAWHGVWTLDASLCVLVGVVAGTLIALCDVRRGFALAVIAGGYGVAFWWIGGRINADWGPAVALTAGVIALLTAAAHHAEILQEDEPANPLRSADPAGDTQRLEDIL